MAEFQEVMKQAKRMCRQIADCNECPLDLPEGCKMQPYSLPDKWDVEEFEKAADIVMDWAEKYPEPRYPTWNEWYKATFPNSNYHTSPCPSMFYKICETSNYHAEVECYECKNTPIPADIAEKLGVKPIGGDADA